MAKQAGHIKITGKEGNLVFYAMDGQYYVRRKSSLTGKQFRTKKCFEGSRKSAERFAEGNRIASEIYKSLPEKKRLYVLYCALKSKAIALLKQGMERAAVTTALQQFTLPPKRKKRLKRKRTIAM